jgi:hypothetical protein
VEARILCTNIGIINTKFLYDHIFTQFGYPLTIIIDQGTHFINYLVDHFILKHIKQVEFTNKVFWTLFSKLVNENWSDWDEHMSTILFSYTNAFKVGSGHIPFQVVYKLHPFVIHEIFITIQTRINP